MSPNAEDAAKVTGRRTMPLSEANALYGFVNCCDCGVGGHTGHTLYTVVKNVVTGATAKACAQHVGNYVRPKDLKQRH